ncbi:hypothetical protein A1O3_08821 [Capronia epimyces CBS 606.96]|uniref:Uncharacterized protein n=1 Tax=Capronia epimyces CBS 606.96 TaxID=1182542 RepID=W9YAB8_9EURO|nr:uncharacterized protein A1O3_08821 [Capronia epimyces CBS 606.96]EXJ79319.1 hypothetical protein A1O3_08821 [Capronia epimyces CBS 606.96]
MTLVARDPTDPEQDLATSLPGDGNGDGDGGDEAPGQPDQPDLTDSSSILTADATSPSTDNESITDPAGSSSMLTADATSPSTDDPSPSDPSVSMAATATATVTATTTVGSSSSMSTTTPVAGTTVTATVTQTQTGSTPPSTPTSTSGATTTGQPSTIIVISTVSVGDQRNTLIQPQPSAPPTTTQTASKVDVGTVMRVLATRTFDPRIPIPSQTCPRMALAALAFWRDFCGFDGIKDGWCWARAPSIDRCCGAWYPVDDDRAKKWGPVYEKDGKKKDDKGRQMWKVKKDRKMKGSKRMERKVVEPEEGQYDLDDSQVCKRWSMAHVEMYRFYTQYFGAFGIEDVNERGISYTSGKWGSWGDHDGWKGVQKGPDNMIAKPLPDDLNPDCYCDVHYRGKKSCLCRSEFEN